MEILPVNAKLNADVKVDLAPVVQATADTISTSHKGVGKLLNAFVGPWIANRERAIALLQAQTQRDCRQIAEGELIYQEGRLLSAPDQRQLPNVYETIHGLNHQADAKRLEAAIREAVRQMSEVPSDQISDEPISPTFFNHWRREAEMIDEEDVRRWWAGLLVEEAKKSNGISLKTVDVMKNLSKFEIEVFQNICRGEIDGEIIVGYDNNPAFGSYNEVVLLQDIGLLCPLEAAIKVKNVGTEEKRDVVICFNGCDVGLLIQTDSFWMRAFSITRAGLEILRLIGRPKRTALDVRTIGGFIRKEQLNPSRVSIVNMPEVSGQKTWEWEHCSRPACFS